MKPRTSRWTSGAALAAALLVAGPAAAQGEGPLPGEPPVASGAPGGTPVPDAAGAATPAPPRDEVKLLAEELRRLKLEIGLRDVEYASHAGMGPAASKVYFAPKGLSLGGYGETYYRNQLGETGSDACATNAAACDVSDVLRAVLYTGYRFSDRIVFNSEVEFEHQRQVFVEFAYLDFMLHERVNVRAGNVLVPIGLTNELHEPVFFNGVERPEVERNLIPSTWNENGIGVYGELVPGLTYKAFLVGGLNAARKPTPGNWIRGLRTRGGTTASTADERALAETFGGALALAWQRGPVQLGASAYHGRAGQGQVVQPLPQTATQTRPQDLREIDAEVTLVEAHVRVGWRGAELKALAAQGTLSDAALINAKHELKGSKGIASRVRGAYVEAGYDVMPLLGMDAQLSPFVRYEALRLHDEVPEGFSRDPALDVDLVTTGLTYKPIPTVALKADYTWRGTAASSGSAARALNLGVSFVF
jgi:hypothetical protein